MNPQRWQRAKELFSEAIALEGEARNTFLEGACADDVSLRAELDSLLRAHSAPEAIVDRHAADYLPDGEVAPEGDHWLGIRVGPYELVERIGSGGMGEVYRARRADAQFEKQVAIKLVRFGFDTALILERFRAERQILANLEHPGIARLLDGGVTTEGLPYLVMELIGGEPIDRYCENHGLAIADRLRLFQQVCDAVSYAHQRLVVHRDLKPSNILVTAAGAIKLLDFGIAKVLREPMAPFADATVTAVTPLTPAFSSPEQIRGLAITTASDVYSLGVILFHLLTGRSPYRSTLASPHTAMEEVCEADPARPSAVAAQTNPNTRSRAIPDRELDDITLKALRKEPEKRYASVEQLSADIERYLTGLPVLAHGGQFSYLAGKFVRRHRLELAAAAIIAATLVGGLVMTAHQARVAQREQARAERNFSRVRALADSLLFELHDSIKDLPGATKARKLLVQEALRYLAELSEDAAGDLGLQRDLAAGYERIGDVQGKPFAASLGDTAGALRSYGLALKLRQGIYAQSGNVADGLSFAQVLRQHASALAMSGKSQGAGEEMRRALRLTEPLVRTHPGDSRFLEELYQEYADLAGVLGGNFNSANLADRGAARAAHEQQLDAATRLVALDPANSGFRGLQIVSQINLGDQLLVEGKVREGGQYFLNAQPALESLARSAPTAQNLQRLHALYTRLSFLRLWEREPTKAATVARTALEISQRLAGDAKDAYAQLDLAIDYANLADPLSQLGQLSEAHKDAARALEIMAAIRSANPSNGEFQVTQGLVLYIAGEIESRHGDRPAALRFFREALEIFEAVHTVDPNNTDARLHVVSMLVRTADVQAATGNVSAARASYTRALSLASGDPAAEGSEEARYAFAGAYYGLARLERKAAGVTHLTTAERQQQLAAACESLAHGDHERARIQEIGALSPNGFHLLSSDDPQRLRARCLQHP